MEEDTRRPEIEYDAPRRELVSGEKKDVAHTVKHA